MKEFRPARTPRIVGVIGGMGPLATVDFMQQLVELSPSLSDQEHIPAIVAQIPQIPDRVGAILRATESPLPQLTESLRRLERAGADFIVMPCNTAHYWHKDLAAATDLPFIHIVDSVLEVLAERGLKPDAPVGLLATPATFAAGIYANRPDNGSALQFVAPTESEIQEFVIPAIGLVKAGRVQDAGILIQECVHRLRARGLEYIVLGCTELPMALKAVGVAIEDGYIDSTAALAKAAIKAALPTPDLPQDPTLSHL
ncbi:aspartate/glutamate racemase family protein [Pollutimonas subterranea]|nr:amino acid racemase [Pollutimonas subterranea]